ncbi:MAG TPA: EAL domain-containing protein [Candidatus Polarisedimenticolaceae bacterium]|nr:EAL domain-containing protein [Candidatus Polarisedimenticolaceae bacterium]
MSPNGERTEPERWHYLKLRSVLYDRITGLPSFPVLIDRLRGWLELRRAIGVIHVEAENLSLVESLYGWQVFDRILERVAGVLTSGVRELCGADAALGLNGVAGDRFALFVASRLDGGDVDTRYLAETAETLRRRLDRAFAGDDFAGLNPKLEFRLGHAMLSHDPFFRFERQLYTAIDQARSADHRRLGRQLRGHGDDLLRILRDAELRTVFQPVVDLRSGATLGYEAFARGPVDTALEAPRMLFRVSDRLGVSRDLDSLCRKLAVEAAARLPRPGKVFLNGLPDSFRAVPTAAAAWPERLRPLRDEPERWVLEFSERAADGDPEGFVSTLDRLKRHGLAVSVEDIGTGFTSQAILEELRPDFLKLDVTLVRKIDQNLIKQELLRSLVRIATRIGASVIAEGVETEQEARALTEAGARYGQGHLFARPTSRIEELRGRVP